ncbi:hypothetical protein JKP88DRAFT_227206, partial [Tribonema minus]
MPPAAGGGGEGRGSMLAAIQAGAKLKPAAASPPPAAPFGSGGGKSSLLDAIRDGPKLKKVTPADARPAAAAAVTGAPGGLGAFANPGINDILARRKYLEADESDDSELDDSDWD